MQVESEYDLVLQHGNIKRCQGCRSTFEQKELIIRRYEGINYQTKERTGVSWRNYYYHTNISCIKKVNSSFNGTLKASLHLTPIQQYDLTEKGFRI